MNGSNCNSEALLKGALQRRERAVAVVVLLAGALLAAVPLTAQKAPRVRRLQKMQVRQAMKQERARQPGFFERLRDLPPSEQERILQNDRRFQRLPPERQQKIRENLQRWNQLSPEQKAKLRQRERILAQLTPEQRQHVREMSRQWREMSPAERRNVRIALRLMRNMTPNQRQKFLDSPQFRNHFSPEEQNILRGLGSLFPDATAPDQ